MKTLTKVSQFASLVRFSHTIFALPFALIGYVYGLISTGTPFEWKLFGYILVCMIVARNAAMGFNRWIDRDIDAKNPRTTNREIPTGKISPRAAIIFVIVNCLVFILMAGLINRLCLYLSPVALLVLLGYSYTKRFTSWSHVVLGCALAIAPVGAYIAVTGSFAMMPILLAGVVLTWTAGFDIIYSLQDTKFDRENKLFSIPAKFSVRNSIIISIVLHLISIYGVVIIGMLYGNGILYNIGAGAFILVLIVQHFLARPSRIEKIGVGFTLINGIASVLFAALTIADMILK